MATTHEVKIKMVVDGRESLATIQLTNEQLRKLGSTGKAAGKDLEQAFGKALGDKIRQALSIGAAVNALQAGMTKAVDFGATITRVGALTAEAGEDMGAHLGELRETAKRLGAETAFSATEAAQGMAELGAAGFNAAQTMEALPGVLDAAAAGQVDLSRTAEIVGSTLKSFGLDVSETGRVVDVLAQADAKSAAGIADMGETMSYAAPVAKMMGLSLEDTAAAAMAMAEAGIKGSRAGTALQGGLFALASPSKRAAELMEQVGLKVTDVQGRMLPVPELVGRLNESLGGMTEAQRSAALELLVGREAASGFAAMMAQGQEKVQGFKTSLQTSQGVAERMAEFMTDNLKGDLDEMGGAFETFAMEVMQAFDGDMREAVQFGTTILRDLANGVKSSAQTIQHLTEVVVVNAQRVLPFVAGWKAYQGVQLLANTATARHIVRLWAATAASSADATATGVAAGAKRVYATATSIATTAAKGFAAAVRANPVGFFIGLLTAAASAYLLLRRNANVATEALRRQTVQAWELARAIHAATGAALVQKRDEAALGLRDALVKQDLARQQMRYLVGQGKGPREVVGRGGEVRRVASPEWEEERRKFQEASQAVRGFQVALGRASEAISSDPTAQLVEADQLVARLVAAGRKADDPRLVAARAERDRLQQVVNERMNGPELPPGGDRVPQGGTMPETTVDGDKTDDNSEAEQKAKEALEALRRWRSEIGRLLAEGIGNEFDRQEALIKDRFAQERAEIAATAAAAREAAGLTAAQKEAITTQETQALDANRAAEARAIAENTSARRAAAFREREQAAQIEDERKRLAGEAEEVILAGRLARLNAELQGEAEGSDRRKELAQQAAQVDLDIERREHEQLQQMDALLAQRRVQAMDAAQARAEDEAATRLLGIKDEHDREVASIQSRAQLRVERARRAHEAERAEVERTVTDAEQKRERLAQAEQRLTDETEDARRDAARETFELQKQLEQERWQMMKDLAQGGFDLITGLWRAGHERRMQDIEAQKSAELAALDEQMAALERQGRVYSQQEAAKMALQQKRAGIEAKYREQERQEKTRQAKREKAAALFQIALQTAIAVVEALPNIPKSVAVGVLGAVQLAVAAAMPIPQFATGVTGFGGGAAIVGERGPELVTLGSGSNVVTNERIGQLLGLASAGASPAAAVTLSTERLEKKFDALAQAIGDVRLRASGQELEGALADWDRYKRKTGLR
ncbi:MAG: phage tail tape measure protein [Rhodothermales bacterium]|nr:phage tail tape measure protein [Rhodothermales bacterium]